MDKKQKNTEKARVAKNYELKSDAVDALANADSEEAPEYSREELEKYRSRSRIRIPDAVKILFIKAWFAGAVCFFFLWGLGTYVSSMIDMLFILGVVFGIVTDLLVNNVIRFIEKTPGENDKWLMFPKKGMMSFFLNILYCLLIIVCVYSLYNVLNYAIIGLTGNTDTVPLGVEPILFGVFCMAFDMLFVGIKQLMKRIFSDAKQTVNSREKKGQAENE